MSDKRVYPLLEVLAHRWFVAEMGHTGLSWDSLSDGGKEDYRRYVGRFLEGLYDPDRPVIVLDTAVDKLWLERRVDPDSAGGPMTPEKLRWIAGYVDECDSIIKRMLERARASGTDIPEEVLEFVDGKDVQRDLHRWADELESAGG